MTEEGGTSDGWGWMRSEGMRPGRTGMEMGE